jgi:predicted DNA-binding transcriptional regulator YafY
MRNAEVIRQWTLLRTLEAARQGASVRQLATELEVTTRTIWRDMDALEAVGFPLYSEKDGRETVWKLNAAPSRVSRIWVSHSSSSARFTWAGRW